MIEIARRIKHLPDNCMKYIESENIKKGKIRFNKNGLNNSKRDYPEIIISLTSYPGRIDIVPGTIASLLRQTFKPDRIILWLGLDKFPENKLPGIYEDIKKSGVQIEFREDLKSHTKYFYAMKEYPDAIIITVDDDRIYDKRLVECLIKSYTNNPHDVSAMRIHKMTFNDKNELMPYKEWIYEYENNRTIKSYRYFATGVGGVLYPPHCLHKEVFNVDFIKKYCHNHDDLWLKIMEVLAETRVVIASAPKVMSYNIYNSQDSGQYIENVVQGGNDIQTQNVLKFYNHYYQDKKSILEVILEDKQE